MWLERTQKKYLAIGKTIAKHVDRMLSRLASAGLLRLFPLYCVFLSVLVVMRKLLFGADTLPDPIMSNLHDPI